MMVMMLLLLLLLPFTIVDNGAKPQTRVKVSGEENASDALDKLCYQSMTDPGKIEAQPNLCIMIIPDQAKSSITIETSG
eukprot:11901450-Karenia_brevis.AAC.1